MDRLTERGHINPFNSPTDISGKTSNVKLSATLKEQSEDLQIKSEKSIQRLRGTISVCFRVVE